MTEPRWLSSVMVLAIHGDQIREHGGAPGLRDKDKGLLESALARPRHAWSYSSDCTLLSLAASYGFGLARNHAFADGNKRVSFQAMYVFLGMNGIRITAPEAAVMGLMLRLAAGELDEAQIITWLGEHSQPRTA